MFIIFYDVLKKLCAEHDTNVTALCRELKLTTGNTGHWKKGKTPSVKVLQRIADYFNVSTDYLLGKTDITNARASSIEEIPETLRELMHQKLGRYPTDDELSQMLNFQFIGDTTKEIAQRLEKLTPENLAIAYDFLAVLLKNQEKK